MAAMPAFTGFPAETTAFLANLMQHNERAWFEAHRNDYERFVLAPAQAFVRVLGARLQVIAPEICVDDRVNGSGVLMRIHRDTHFRKRYTQSVIR